MKRELLDILRLQGSPGRDWDLEVTEENEREIRKGTLSSKNHDQSFLIEDGILNLLKDLPPEVLREKEHAEKFDYLVTVDGKKHPINRQTIDTHQDLFLSLPSGDGSSLFRSGGSFDNQGGNADRFFKTLDLLNFKKGDRVLEVGTSFSWASRHIANRGCEVVALDVTNYMMAGDLFFEKDGCYFDRVMSDMSQLPFDDNSFDVIFSHSVIHHCKDLSKLFAELHRVLKPGGRAVALHECAFGLLESKSGKALQKAIDEGFNENAYTIPEWYQGARKGGFRKIKWHFFSFFDDYVDRKKLHKAPMTFKLKAAYWMQKHKTLHAIINQLSIIPRIIWRPRTWMIIAIK